MNLSSDNIGNLKYLATIVTGRNRQVSKFTTFEYQGDDQIPTIQKGDYVVTIGRKYIIITLGQEPRRAPILIRKWIKIQNDGFDQWVDTMKGPKGGKMRTETFIDSSDHLWRYRTGSDFGDSLTANGPVDTRIICEIEF